MIPALRRLWHSSIVEPWQRISRENRAFLDSDKARRLDAKVILVLVTAAVVLTIQNYWASNPRWIVTLLTAIGQPTSADRFDALMNDSEDAPLWRYVYWALFSFTTYVVPPCVVIRLFGERIRDYGVKPRGAFTDWWIYGVLFGIMLPILFVVSHSASFQATYPLYKIRVSQPLWPRFWVWELSYGLQFVGLEFFFRGFMIHGTKHRFGFYAIFVMMPPYCMIHFGKPMPETFAAIVAGIVLGFMSLKTRSIWMGAAIHMSVALSMDFLSLWQRGLFP